MIDNTANNFASLFGSAPSDEEIAKMEKPGRGKTKYQAPAWMKTALETIESKGQLWFPLELHKKFGQKFGNYVKGEKVPDSNPAQYENGARPGMRVSFEARAVSGKTTGYVAKIVKV